MNRVLLLTLISIIGALFVVWFTVGLALSFIGFVFSVAIGLVAWVFRHWFIFAVLGVLWYAYRRFGK